MTASGHGELPGERGNANAVDGIGSGQKIATGHVESSINPRIETRLPESESERAGSRINPKIATEKTTTSDTLDRLIANSKRSESENDGHDHESCPTGSGLYNPSLLLDPKIGKHGRIEKRSGPPKPLSTHHVAERAVMSGEKQPRKRCGQGKSAATEQPPSLQLPEELKRQRRARAQQTNIQRHFPPPPPPPLARLRSSGRRGSFTGHNTRCTPRHPLLTCPPERREEEEEEVSGCGTSKEVPARGEAPGSGGTEPEGRDFLRSL